MKKKLLFAFILIVTAVLLAGCIKIGSRTYIFSANDLIFQVNDNWNENSITFQEFYNGKPYKAQNVTIDMVTGFDTSATGIYQLTVKYKNFTEDFNYQVVNEKYPIIKFDTDAPELVVEDKQVLYGTSVELPVLTRVGYVFDGWFLNGVLYTSNEIVTESITLKAHWKEKYQIVTFADENNLEITIKSVRYGETLEYFEPALPPYIKFLGWYLNGNIFNFDTPIIEDITLIAKVEFNLDTYKSWIIEKMQDIIKDLRMYSEEKVSEIQSIFDDISFKISTSETKEAVLELFNSFVNAIGTVHTLSDELTAYYNSINKNDYFAHHYDEITEIYNLALEKLNNYNGGAPEPRKIYSDTIEAIEKVPTMAEDIELAKYEKQIKLNALKNYYESINKAIYSTVNLENLENTYNLGCENINNAVGTKAVAEAYAAAIKSLDDIIPNEYMESVYNTYAGLNSNDYFEWQWAEIVEIYNSAMSDLREYVGGAPSEKTISDTAIEAMLKVTTKAEDIELANTEKQIKSRDLTNLFNSLKEIEYTTAIWNTIKTAYENGINAINEAVGTKAVAAAYAAAYEVIVANKDTKIANLDAINTLTNKFNEYKEADYFEDQWTELNKIYNDAALAIRDYVGGAPSVETILNTAIEAMDKVVTKAEDIELANTEKQIKSRDLTNLFNSLKEIEYTTAIWNTIKTAYENGINAINEAVGTKAVAAAYAAAYEVIVANKDTKIANLDAINTLTNKFNEYKEADYFEDQWTELNKIYNDAALAIRDYVGGAPSVETILNTAIEAMDKVVTKAEDIELANTEKQIKSRDLTNLFNSLKEIEYTTAIWNTIKTAYENGINAINEAVGTKAVAAAYAAAYEVIVANKDTKIANLDAINTLTNKFNEYKEADYFEDQWTELNKIYNDAALAIRDYVGGAPSVETILNTALEAMDKVVTKAEDIELANTEKQIKLRDLKNYYDSIDKSAMTVEAISQLETAYNNGVKAINDAIGTKAVADAYANALAALKAIIEG